MSSVRKEAESDTRVDRTSLRTCGEHIPYMLADMGVDTVFGIPGVHSLELYRGLRAAGINHVSARHEQGAGFMADGYARASGRPGVALLISGPGVTNASTAIGQAYSDSIPVLVLSAALARQDLGMNRGALHEIVDQRAVTQPITGLSVLAHTADQVAAHLITALGRLHAARPRPVHVSLPMDVLAETAFARPTVPAPPSRPAADPDQIQRLAELLRAARRPVIIAGGGAVGAADELRELVELTGALFVSTIAGKGIVPESHGQSLGASMQRAPVRRAIAEADLVVAIGTELFIEEPEGGQDAIFDGPSGKIPLMGVKLPVTGHFARIDIDVEVAIRDYSPDIAIVADAALAARALCRALSNEGQRKDTAGVVERAQHIREQVDAGLSPLESMHDRLLKVLREALPAETLVYADMTQLAYTGCMRFEMDVSGGWHFPQGYGTLGYALPAAIGGKLAAPERPVAAIIGDGGLQYTLQDLGTASELKLPIPFVLWDNDALGDIVDAMRSTGIDPIACNPRNPDFSLLARSYGAEYSAPSTLDELRASVAAALNQAGPSIIHLRQRDFEPRQ